MTIGTRPEEFEMPPLTWILQENLRDQRFLQVLKETLGAIGQQWCSEALVPFSPDLPKLAQHVHGGRVVCYGPSFVPRVCDAPDWRPGIFFDRNTFRWSSMQSNWGELMFSPDGRVTSLGNALSELADVDGRRFVRPDADDKLFDGGLYTETSLREATENLEPTKEVIVAESVRVDAEWRTFVVSGEVVGGSEYRRAGRASVYPGVPPRVQDLVEEAARLWTPSPVVCIDVASHGDHFGIVEANCFNASRFYASNTKRVLEAVSSFCLGTS